MLQFYEFTLPFRSVFKTGAGDFLQRSGTLIHFSDHSTQILAEASPLPGFSRESLADVKESCTRYKVDIDHFLLSDFSVARLRSFLQTLPDIPSFQFALSYLGLEIISERRQVPFHVLLERPFTRNLKVNVVIGGGDMQQVKSKIEKGVKKGFNTFKIKAPHPAEPLAKKLEQLYIKFPGIKFRLDANQTWPVQKLDQISSLFSGLPVEYIEEPVSTFGPEKLSDIISACRIPIALDESINSLSMVGSALKNYPETTLIIKPSLFGNLFDLIETICRFSTPLSNIIITTTIEARIGRSMIASIASVIGDPQAAHGLNTGHLLRYDLLDDFTISEGVLELPESGSWKHSPAKINSNLLNGFS
ncbi:MAG: enolase C-terminal domain-like protein [Balneolaceae bacterium]